MLTGPDVEVPGESVYEAVWSGDGKKLYAGSHDDDPSYGRGVNLRHWVIDTKTLRATELKLPEGHHLLDVSADGKLFLTRGPAPNPQTDGRPIWVVPADGSKAVRLTDSDEGSYDGRISPDGTRVILAGADGRREGKLGPGRAPRATANYFLDVISVAGGKRSPVFVCKDRQYAWKGVFSPDGTRVAYLPRTHSFPKIHDDLTVSRPDGTDAKVLLSVDHESAVCLDWR